MIAEFPCCHAACAVYLNGRRMLGFTTLRLEACGLGTRQARQPDALGNGAAKTLHVR